MVNFLKPSLPSFGHEHAFSGKAL